jgi:hypothetical protein
LHTFRSLTTNNYSAIINSYILNSLPHAKSFQSDVFTCRCSVTAFNGERSLILGSRTNPVPQLPVRNSNGSQEMNLSSPPTNSLINHLLHFTHLHFTALKVKVKVRVSLRLEAYRQSVHSGVKPLETHDQIFFQLDPCGNSPYVTSSLTREWVCLL